MSGALSGATKNLGAFGKAGLAIGAGAAAGVAAATSAYAGFEQQLSNVKAVSGATEAEIAKLGAAAKQIGIDTTFSSKEAAGAFVELSKAGISTANILGGVGRAAVDLAAAGELDMATASEIASAAINSFKLEAKDAAHVADLLAGAASSTATDVFQAGESLKILGPAASTAGVSIDDAVTSVGALAKIGITGAEAGTALQTALLRLSAPANVARAKMDELGIEIFDAQGNIKSMADVAGELKDGLAGLTKEQQTAALAVIFGNRGIKAGAALAAQGAEGMRELAGAIGQMSAADMAKEKLDNLNGSITLMKGSFETLLVGIGESFAPVIRSVVDAMTGFLNVLIPIANNISANVVPAVQTMLAAFAPLGGMLDVARAMILDFIESVSADPGGWAAGIATAITTLLIPALGVLLSFFSPVIAGFAMVAPVALAFGLAVKNAVSGVGIDLERVTEMLSTFMFAFQNLQGNPFERIEQGLNALKAQFPEAAGTVNTLLDALNSVETAVTTTVDVLTALGEAALTVGGFLVEHREILIGVGAAFVALKTQMALSSALASVEVAFSVLQGTMIATGGTMGAVKLAAQMMWTAIGGPVGLVIAAIGIFAAAWAGNWGGIREHMGGTAGLIRTVITGIATGLAFLVNPLAGLAVAWSTNFVGIRESRGRVASAIFNFLGNIAVKLGVPHAAITQFAHAWQAGWSSAGDILNNFINMALDKLGALGSGIRNVLGMLGVEIGGGMAEAVGRGAERINMSTQDIIDKNGRRATEIAAQTGAAMNKIGSSEEAFLQKSGQRVRQANQKATDAIGEGADAMAGAAFDAGAGAGDAMGDGMESGSSGGQNPVDSAMQTISAVAGAITAGLDAAEKMFTFRGSPPAELMDEVFAMLKDMAKRAIALASDIGPEIAEQAGKAWQMLSTVTSTLQGMVDLGDKLARFRVPTAENMTALKDLAKRIAKIALEITDMFLSGDLQSSLEDLAVGQKVAENLSAWTSLLKDMAEATGAIARARLDVDMSPVFAFIHMLVDFSLALTQELKTRLGDKLRVLLADSKDVADTLKPWAELLKMMGEVTKSLATSRWPSDMSAPLQFIEQLADMSITMLNKMRADLGPTILVALEDSKLIGENIKVWAESIKGVSEASQAMAKARFDQPLAPLSDFLVSLLDIVLFIRQHALNELGSALLVALEDSTEIAKTFKEWLEPISKIGEVAEAIDVLRSQSQDRMDTTLTALGTFLLDIATVTGRVVQRAWQELGDGLLLAMEDSTEVAKAFSEWMKPLESVGKIAEAVDTLRMQSQTRWDTTLTLLGDFLLGIATVTGIVLQSAWRELGANLLRSMEDSREVAETFGKWLDPLAKVGQVAESVDVLRGFVQTRWDTSLDGVFDMLMDIGARTATIAAAASREADPTTAQEISKKIAESFNVWLDVMVKSADAAKALIDLPDIGDDAFARVQSLLESIAGRTAAMVRAASRSADPNALQDLSQKIAGTFGAWLDVMAKVGEATQSIAGMVDVPESALDDALSILTRIAGRTSVFVAAVARGADPGKLQELSQKVAQTFMAWVELFTKTAELTRKMVEVEPVDPAKFAILEGFVSDVMAATERLAARFKEMSDKTRTDLVNALNDYVGAAGGAVDLFARAAEATAKIAETKPVEESDLNIIEASIKTILNRTRKLAQDFLPEVVAEYEALAARMQAYIDVAGPAVDLFASAATIGADTAEAVSVQGESMNRIRDAIKLIVSMVQPMADMWAEAQHNMTQSVANAKAFADTAGAALSVVSDAVDTIRAITEDDIGPVSTRAMVRIRQTISNIMGMIDSLAKGYLDAKGNLDEARTNAIAGFSKAASEAAGAVGATVDTLKALTENQGALGSMTATAKALIKNSINDMVEMLLDLADGFSFAEFESRRAIERAAEFSKSVSEIAGGISDVIGTLSDVAAFLADDSSKQITKNDRFAETVRGMLESNITMMIESMDQVLSDLGPDMITRAAFVGEKVGPIADAVGSLIEPVQKLIENPFTKISSRTRLARTGGQYGALKHGNALGAALSKGLKDMVNAIVKGLSDVKVPSGMPPGLVALTELLLNVMDIVEQAMALPEIDFGKLEDLRRAAEILGGTQFSGGMVGGGAAAGGGGGMPGGSFTLQGPFVIQSGQFMGVIRMDGATIQQDVIIDGESIQKTQKTDNFTIGDARAAQEAPEV